MAGRDAHARQFERMNRQIKFPRTRLGRIIRDIGRKIDGDEALQETFAVALSRAAQIRGQIKKELRRRSAIEAVIGHGKTDGRLGGNFLKGRLGDHINAVISAVGYNPRLILKWLRKLLPKIIAAIGTAINPQSALKPAS